MDRSDRGFEDFYTAHAARLTKVAHSIVRDRHVAEDVVQTAFVKAFASWWRVGRADDPVAYTRRIVVNAALAHLRQPAVRRERAVAIVPDHAFDPDATVTTRGDIWLVLERLPPRRRAIVVLRYYEGLSEREIADVLGCRPGTVKSQASAALKTLRDQLAVDQDASEGSEGGARR